MIDRDAEPIAHRSPYKRVDLSRPRRLKPIITRQDVIDGDMVPDPALYNYCPVYDLWRRKP